MALLFINFFIFVFLDKKSIGPNEPMIIKTCAEDFVSSDIPPIKPKINAMSNFIVLASKIEKNNIQIKPALTPESDKAKRS